MKKESLSQSEENYLKAIYKIWELKNKPVSTNDIAAELSMSAASVTEMIKRLSEKKLADYQRYKGVTLSAKGKKTAVWLVRKHRLWEVFLYEKLNFSWDEVHEMAEDLEHIQYPKLIERLDVFLGHPTVDPHGDPIPDKDGIYQKRRKRLLASLAIGEEGLVVGVVDDTVALLQYLDKVGMTLGASIKIIEIMDFDESVSVSINQASPITISKKVAQNLFIGS